MLFPTPVRVAASGAPGDCREHFGCNVELRYTASRRGFVKAVSSQCNESNYQHHFYRESDNRHAYLCFLEEYGFVFTIKNFDPAQIEK